MNVRTLCLAILYDGEASGYEIRKLSTEGKYAYFVEASFGAIYPALARLEDDGLVTSRVEVQEGRPAKKVYAITQKGRNALFDALHEPLREDVFRSEFLLFARFAGELPASLVETRSNTRLQTIEDDIAGLTEILEKKTHAGDAWVVRFGLACLEAARGHMCKHMAELVGMARDDSRTDAAAE